MKFLTSKIFILSFKIITLYFIYSILLVNLACTDSDSKVSSGGEIKQHINMLEDIPEYPTIYQFCYPDSCNGNYVANELYNIDSYFTNFSNVHKLDSLFKGYLIETDSTIVSHVQIEAKRPIYYVTRKYYHPDSDSSNFIFHSYLIDEYPMRYELFSARITDDKFIFTDSVYIGVSKNKVSRLVEQYLDPQFKLRDNCHIICDTINVMCDGLGGVCKYIFLNRTLHEIHFQGVTLE